MALYLFIFSIDVHFLGADGLADVVDVIFSAVVKDVLILFPESNSEKKKKNSKKEAQSANLIYVMIYMKLIKTCGAVFTG